MKVLDVYPKDVYITFEMSLKQAKQVLDFLDNCTIEYNSEENPKLASAVNYVTNEFFRNLDKTVEHIEKGV